MNQADKNLIKTFFRNIAIFIVTWLALTLLVTWITGQPAQLLGVLWYVLAASITFAIHCHLKQDENMKKAQAATCVAFILLIICCTTAYGQAQEAKLAQVHEASLAANRQAMQEAEEQSRKRIEEINNSPGMQKIREMQRKMQEEKSR